MSEHFSIRNMPLTSHIRTYHVVICIHQCEKHYTESSLIVKKNKLSLFLGPRICTFSIHESQAVRKVPSAVKSIWYFFPPFLCLWQLESERLSTRLCKITNYIKMVKESCNRPGVAQRVPGGLVSQISMTFGTWRGWGCEPHALAAFIPRKCSWYSFSLGAETTPGLWYGRKEYVTEKSSETTGNRCRDRPTSSAVP